MPLKGVKGEAICEHTVTLFILVFVFFFLVNPPVYEGTKELLRTPLSVNPLSHEVLSMGHVLA